MYPFCICDLLGDRNMDSRQAFGQYIRGLRTQMGLSQDELAFRCGLTTPMISYIEKGERNSSFETLEKLAHGLGVTMAMLFDYGENHVSIYDEDTNKILSLVLGLNPTQRKQALRVLKALNCDDK